MYNDLSPAVARVFPRRTNATPDDELAFTDIPGFFPPAVDKVEISVAFTWDLPRAEFLEENWKHIAPVEIGGPATGQPSGQFVPGKFLKRGITITSRGCPNKCWFCSVWKREPKLMELPICDGYNVMDDNLLACSDDHVNAVFDMLERQKEPIVFSGGIEAALVKPWHVERLAKLKLKTLYMAYDTPDDLEPLMAAAKLMEYLPIRTKQCYVLMGYPGDTQPAANDRLMAVLRMDVLPFAMLWRNERGEMDAGWRRLQREWVRMPIVMTKYNEVKNGQ